MKSSTYPHRLQHCLTFRDCSERMSEESRRGGGGGGGVVEQGGVGKIQTSSSFF